LFNRYQLTPSPPKIEGTVPKHFQTTLSAKLFALDCDAISNPQCVVLY